MALININSRESYARYSRYFVELKQIYNEKPEVRASLEILLTVLTISFFIVFAIRPTANTIATLFSDINSQKEVKEKLDKKITDLSTARQVWSKEQNRLKLIDDALPKSSSPDLFLRQIEGLAVTNKTTLSNFAVEQTTLYGNKPKIVQDLESQQPKSDLPSVNKTRIAFTVNGQFIDIVNVLHNLNNMRKIILTDTISIMPRSSGAKNTGEIILKITGYAPYYEINKK